MKPNPPRMITVLVAIALTLVGLALAFLPEAQIAGLVRALPLGGDLTRQVLDWAADRTIAFVALAASPVLLVVGSLVRGI